VLLVPLLLPVLPGPLRRGSRAAVVPFGAPSRLVTVPSRRPCRCAALRDPDHTDTAVRNTKLLGGTPNRVHGATCSGHPDTAARETHGRSCIAPRAVTPALDHVVRRGCAGHVPSAGSHRPATPPVPAQWRGRRPARARQVSRARRQTSGAGLGGVSKDVRGDDRRGTRPRVRSGIASGQSPIPGHYCQGLVT
jgi:hypothetical protein